MTTRLWCSWERGGLNGTSQGAFWPLLQGHDHSCPWGPKALTCFKATLPFLPPLALASPAFGSSTTFSSYLVHVRYDCRHLGYHDPFSFEKGRIQGTHLGNAALTSLLSLEENRDFWVTAFPYSNMRFQPASLHRAGGGWNKHFGDLWKRGRAFLELVYLTPSKLREGILQLSSQFQRLSLHLLLFAFHSPYPANSSPLHHKGDALSSVSQSVKACAPCLPGHQVPEDVV